MSDLGKSAEWQLHYDIPELVAKLRSDADELERRDLFGYTDARAAAEALEQQQRFIDDWDVLHRLRADNKRLRAENERLTKDLRELDPDPVVCGCREALCPHTPVARLPRRELVNHFKQRIKDSATETERLRAVLERFTNGYKYSTEVVTMAREALRGGEEK